MTSHPALQRHEHLQEKHQTIESPILGGLAIPSITTSTGPVPDSYFDLPRQQQQHTSTTQSSDPAARLNTNAGSPFSPVSPLSPSAPSSPSPSMFPVPPSLTQTNDSTARSSYMTSTSIPTPGSEAGVSPGSTCDPVGFSTPQVPAAVHSPNPSIRVDADSGGDGGSRENSHEGGGGQQQHVAATAQSQFVRPPANANKSLPLPPTPTRQASYASDASTEKTPRSPAFPGGGGGSLGLPSPGASSATRSSFADSTTPIVRVEGPASSSRWSGDRDREDDGDAEDGEVTDRLGPVALARKRRAMRRRCVGVAVVLVVAIVVGVVVAVAVGMS